MGSFVHMFMLNKVDDTERSTSLFLQPLYVGLIGFFVIFSYVSMLIARIPLLSDMIAICGKYSLALAVIHIFLVRVVLALFYTLPTDTVFPPLSTVQILVLGVFDVVTIVTACMLIDKKKTDRNGC